MAVLSPPPLVRGLATTVATRLADGSRTRPALLASMTAAMLVVQVMPQRTTVAADVPAGMSSMAVVVPLQPPLAMKMAMTVVTMLVDRRTTSPKTIVGQLASMAEVMLEALLVPLHKALAVAMLNDMLAMPVAWAPLESRLATTMATRKAEWKTPALLASSVEAMLAVPVVQTTRALVAPALLSCVLAQV